MLITRAFFIFILRRDQMLFLFPCLYSTVRTIATVLATTTTTTALAVHKASTVQGSPLQTPISTQVAAAGLLSIHPPIPHRARAACSTRVRYRYRTDLCATYRYESLAYVLSFAVGASCQREGVGLGLVVMGGYLGTYSSDKCMHAEM